MSSEDGTGWSWFDAERRPATLFYIPLFRAHIDPGTFDTYLDDLGPEATIADMEAEEMITWQITMATSVHAFIL
jgi:hypothetical protein